MDLAQIIEACDVCLKDDDKGWYPNTVNCTRRLAVHAHTDSPTDSCLDFHNISFLIFTTK